MLNPAPPEVSASELEAQRRAMPWWRRALRFARRAVSMARGTARLAALAFPLLLSAPLVHVPSLDEYFWRYALWATQAAGPTAVKLAQWASSRTDRFPEQFCTRFSTLQDRASAHSWRHTAAALQRAFGEEWETLLRIEREPVGAGCVAQVHRGTLLRDVALGGVAGEVVAVKVVHPAARARIAVDLDLMRGGVRLLERLAPSTRWLGLVSAIDEFSRTLERQMDMRLEAHHLELFGRNFANVKDVTFPTPRAALCSEDVLVEDFVEGVTMREFIARGPDKVDPRVWARLSETGVNTVCKMIFEDNLLHGDMHPGNILIVREEFPPEVCFLDAGITVELGNDQHTHFVKVLAALMRHDGYAAGRMLIAGNQRFSEKDASAHGGFETAEELAAAQEAFCQTLKSITDKTAEEAFFEKIGDYAARIFEAAADSRVHLEGYFVSTSIAIRVMEGVANALDRDVQIGQLALPWLLSSELRRHNPLAKIL